MPWSFNDGAVVRTLLGTDALAEIDFPPTPDIATGQAMPLELAELPPLGDVADDAPLIGIIDSGVNDHPLIADILVGAIGVPDTLGTADDFGHGTRVAGIATFGDLRGQLTGTTNLGLVECLITSEALTQLLDPDRDTLDRETALGRGRCVST